MKNLQPLRGITLALVCALATSLKAQNIYVANSTSDTIGEYGMDGSTVNTSLISGAGSGLGIPEAIVFSGNTMYVANFGPGTIGEYTSSGQIINSSLITGLGSYSADGLVIAGNNLLVANMGNAVGKYGLDGSFVTANLTPGLDEPTGIALSGNDLFIPDYPHEINGAVEEFTTSGMAVNTPLITIPDLPGGIAISGNDLFISDPQAGTIGEYTTSGTVVNASLITGLKTLEGIAISGDDLFVVNVDTERGAPIHDGGSIGEYTLTGAPVAPALITGLNAPFGIAISPVPEPSAGALAGLGAAVLWLWCRRK